MKYVSATSAIPYGSSAHLRERLDVLETYRQLRGTIHGKIQDAEGDIQKLDAAVESVLRGNLQESSLVALLKDLSGKHMPDVDLSAFAHLSFQRRALYVQYVVDSYLEPQPNAGRIDVKKITKYVSKRLPKSLNYSPEDLNKAMGARGFAQRNHGFFRK